MELYAAMSTLRAVRRIKPDPIPDDVLERVFQAATWAPTGGNHQGCFASSCSLVEIYALIQQGFDCFNVSFVNSNKKRAPCVLAKQCAKHRRLLPDDRTGDYSHFPSLLSLRDIGCMQPPPA